MHVVPGGNPRCRPCRLLCSQRLVIPIIIMMTSKSLPWLALAMLLAAAVVTMAADSNTAAASEDAPTDDLQASSASKVRAPNNAVQHVSKALLLYRKPGLS